ncbi:carboxypeptidase [Bacillus phage Bastille]|uniref:Uncharacterized protein n=1 Tax=Bacillus phage Bastille TaxID=57477 RepID=J9PLQ4_9CAUD|nr:carboxypeptidase [Bacillus phage Bastille]AEQ34330.1 hypothetical protein [Bacillus phage Bastille]
MDSEFVESIAKIMASVDLPDKGDKVRVTGTGDDDYLMVEVFGTQYGDLDNYEYNFIKVEKLKKQLETLGFHIEERYLAKLPVNVYKVNDCDWVAARCEGSAKKYYMEEILGVYEGDIAGVEDFNEYYEGEVPLTDTMCLGIDEVPLRDIQMYNFELAEVYSDKVVRVPFWYVLRDHIFEEPFVIASSEAW